MILIKNMNNFHIRIKMTSAHEGQAAEKVKVQPWGGKSTGDNRKAHCQAYFPCPSMVSSLQNIMLLQISKENEFH